MMCIVIIAQYADCTPCGFGSRQKVRSVVHPRAAILHFEFKGIVETLSKTKGKRAPLGNWVLLVLV